MHTSRDDAGAAPTAANGMNGAGLSGAAGQSPATAPLNLPNPMVGFAHMQAMGLRMLLTQQNEILGFLGRRCEQDLRLLNDIVAASEPKAMMDALTDFYRNAAKDYAVKIGRSVENAPRVAAAAGEVTTELTRAFATEGRPLAPPV